MALLLDTRDVAHGDREECLQEAFLQADVPRRLSLTSPQAVDATRIEAWTFGSTKVFCPESPGLNVVRTAALGQLDPIIALVLQNRGTGLFLEDGARRRLMPGELMMPDPLSENEFLISGASSAFEVPFDEIGVPYETARRASGRLPASPLLPLVIGHLEALRHDAASISSSAAAVDVDAATVRLLRALIVSAAEDDRYTRSAMSDALLPRILAYARHRLSDRDLTPASIAREHHISLRYLYKLCDNAGVTIGEWIIEQRLEGARRSLTAPGRGSQSIASIAHQWGFKDPSHFSTRFRRAYGASPRDARQQSRRQSLDQL